ncbi:hypothetical protein [Mycobacterium sp.]|uniref:hypothetical protein n=1 Tax=Mycobacterium sp. TaxID=1785 RepID=UPI002C761CA3|nr:hypothetical protein [Mycobacterium sp.]HME46860.1 hypothetical protein [Mycobacterium sp.]
MDAELLDGFDDVGDPLVEEPHAATDTAVIPMTASSGYFDIAVLGMVDGSFFVRLSRVRRHQRQRPS